MTHPTTPAPMYQKPRTGLHHNMTLTPAGIFARFLAASPVAALGIIILDRALGWVS